MSQEINCKPSSVVKAFKTQTIPTRKIGIQQQKRQRRSRQPTTLFELSNPVSVSAINPINDEITIVLSKVSTNALSYILSTESQGQIPFSTSLINSKGTKITSSSAKEKTLISNKHNNHKHHDNFEGAVYGLTTMLIVSYSAIFFLYNPNSMFSASELCWSTTNGYIVALISHFLRRNERIRLHHNVDSTAQIDDVQKSQPLATASSQQTSATTQQKQSSSSLQTTSTTGNARLQEVKSFSYRSYSYQKSTTSKPTIPLKEPSLFEIIFIRINNNNLNPTKIIQNRSKYSKIPINKQIQNQGTRMKLSTASSSISPIVRKDADFFIHLLRKFQNDTLQKTQKTTTKVNKKRTIT
jgi:hypothetical protein